MQYTTPGDVPLKQCPVSQQARLLQESSITRKEKNPDYKTAGSPAAQYQVIKIN